MQILVPSFPTKTTSAKQLSSSFPEDSLPSTVAAVGNALLQWPFSCLSSSPSWCSWHSEAAAMPDVSSAIPFRSISDFLPDEMKWPPNCWPQCYCQLELDLFLSSSFFILIFCTYCTKSFYLAQSDNEKIKGKYRVRDILGKIKSLSLRHITWFTESIRLICSNSSRKDSQARRPDKICNNHNYGGLLCISPTSIEASKVKERISGSASILHPHLIRRGTAQNDSPSLSVYVCALRTSAMRMRTRAYWDLLTWQACTD